MKRLIVVLVVMSGCDEEGSRTTTFGVPATDTGDDSGSESDEGSSGDGFDVDACLAVAGCIQKCAITNADCNTAFIFGDCQDTCGRRESDAVYSAGYSHARCNVCGPNDVSCGGGCFSD